MGVPVASGATNMSGVYIPEVWSGKMLIKFYAATLFGAIANTDYEGEISGLGDKVIVRTTPDLEIRKYTIGQPLNVSRPSGGRVELNIDQAEYWNFIVDDIQKMQSDIDFVEKWTADAAEQLKIVIDKNILGTVYADAHPSNRGALAGKDSQGINLGQVGAAVQLTPTNIVDYIVDFNTVLDEQNIPEDGRYLTLPPWAVNRLKRSELKDASITGDGVSATRNGRVGMVDRTEIFTTNNLSTVIDAGARCWNIIGGHKAALTFASQLTKNESLKAESTFGELFRGLQVYGYKTVKSDALGAGFIRR